MALDNDTTYWMLFPSQEWRVAIHAGDSVTSVQTVFIIFILVLAVTALIINILNICAIITSKLNVLLTFKFIIILSLCDAYIDIIAIIGFTCDVCKCDSSLWNSLDIAFNFGSASSLFSLMLISFDLFLKIVFPMQYTAFASRYGNGFIVIMIMNTNMASFVPLLISGITLQTCVVIVLSCLGFLVILTLNLMVCHAIYRLNETTIAERFSIRKSAITIFLVVSTYFSLYFSFWIVNAFHLLGFYEKFYISFKHPDFVLIKLISNLLLIINTLCDPVIYGFRISDIRKVYKTKLAELHRWKRRRN